MPFSPSKNFIFIHITKTAGSSLNNFFRARLGAHNYLFTGHINHEINYFVGLDHNQDMEHLSLPQMYKILGREKASQCFKFTFVRNPFDRLVSTYFWNKQKPHVSQEFRDYFNQCSFEDYVLEGKVQLPSPMHYWVVNSVKQKQLLVDFVGRYENLKEDFENLCHRFKLEPDNLPHAYKTDHKPYQEYYTPAVIDKVKQFYQDDLNLFNYQF